MPAPAPSRSGRQPGGERGTISSYEENSSALAAVSRVVSLWLDRRRRRRVLEDLAERDRLLADVGLTREEALREAGKPFWRA